MDNAMKKKMLVDMIRIRTFELRAKEVFKSGVMPGFLHMYLGEEAVAVGVCAALTKDDYILSTHRGHGHCIAKGAETKYMMAELLGKATGYNKGKGGSMHIAVPALGILGANGIVGGGMPLAIGAAWSAQYQGTDRVAVSFFGDGASNNGTFHESINLAAAYKLPAIFVCENNKYGAQTPFAMISKTVNVADRAAGYNIPGVVVDGNDVAAVYEAAKTAVERARAGEGPTLIECKTYRWDPHCVGKADPRPEDEVETWVAAEPISRYADVLIQEGVVTKEEVDQMWAEATKELDEAIEFGMNSPDPAAETALEDVYTD